METPAAAGATTMTRMVVPVRNLGGTTGRHVMELKVDGETVVSKQIVLHPGEETGVLLEHVFPSGGARLLRVEDFPP